MHASKILFNKLCLKIIDLSFKERFAGKIKDCFLYDCKNIMCGNQTASICNDNVI
jgi:hypothetical protein